MSWIDGDAMPKPKGDVVDDTMNVSFTNWTRADRCKRQILEAIYTADNIEELDKYVEGEDVLIDGLFLFDPEMSREITEAHQDVRNGLLNAQHPRTADPVQSNEGKRRMTKNSDFKKIVVKDVELMWPRLDQTYRYNSAKEETEPAPANAQGAGWSLAWKMAEEDAKALYAELKAHYAECKSRNGSLPEFSKVFGAKKMKDETGSETGFVQFTAKKRAMSNDGRANKEPKVVGLDLQDLEDKAIWSGSTGHIRALAFPTQDPDKNGGVSLLLDAVQVTDAVYGGDGLEDDFGPAKTPEPTFGEDAPAPTANEDDPF